LISAGISQLFENKLREINANVPTLTYDIKDLFTFIDRLPDVSILVFDPQSKHYIPYGRTFIKNQIYKKLSAENH